MREHLDRGLEPIGDVVVRVIDQVALVYSMPWLAEPSRRKILRRRGAAYVQQQHEDEEP